MLQVGGRPAQRLRHRGLRRDGSARSRRRPRPRPRGAPRVVVSSQLTPTWSASTRRSRTPRSRALADDVRGPARHPGEHGVEERVVDDLDAAAAQRVGQARGRAGDPGRDPPQPGGAVVDRVHRGHHREKHLRGADVARRLLAPDVLLAGLQREPVGGVAVGVPGDPDEPARAATARGRRARPCSRRAVRRSRAGRRNAATSRRRRRRPPRPASRAASARAGRRRRRAGLRGRARRRRSDRGRRRRAAGPGYWTRTPKTSAPTPSSTPDGRRAGRRRGRPRRPGSPAARPGCRRRPSSAAARRRRRRARPRPAPSTSAA